MANTYHQLYIQAVFAVKFRKAMLDVAWRSEVFGLIGNLINEGGCKTIIVNGVEDHVHCVFSLKPTVAISDLMQDVKGKSSKYINDQNFMKERFEWQRGYGAFSYHKSLLPTLYRYVENQVAHHKSVCFIDEYKNLLNEHEIAYEDAYIFHEPL
jgi:REP element-mobilizing transposase RayT